MPDEVVQVLAPDERMAIMALTHDPKLDDMALMAAFKSRAFYVGALGSRANNARRRERLKMLDLTENEAARLRVGRWVFPWAAARRRRSRWPCWRSLPGCATASGS